MKKIINTIFISLTLIITSVNAQNGQNYYRYGDINTKLNKRAISEIAKNELRRLVIQNKIDSSWKSVPIKSIDKIPKLNNSWVVKFNNKNIKKENKQVINILVDEAGNIKGAAYSSK